MSQVSFHKNFKIYLKISFEREKTHFSFREKFKVPTEVNFEIKVQIKFIFS